jgi:hypothetical protein
MFPKPAIRYFISIAKIIEIACGESGRKEAAAAVEKGNRKKGGRRQEKVGLERLNNFLHS